MLENFKAYEEKNECAFRGGRLYAFSGVTPAGLAKLAEELKREGFACASKNEIDGNFFAVYVGGEEQVNVAYYPDVAINNYYYPVLKPDGHHDYGIPYLKNRTEGSELKVSVTKRGYLPSESAPEHAKAYKPTVTQMKQMGIGMSYIIQLEDGSFVVIDGGLGIENSLEYQLDFLEAHKPASHEKPRIAWFFTHAHPDHIVMPVKFFEKYGDRVEVTLFAHNLIDETCEYAQTFGDGGKQWTENLMNYIKNSGTDELVLHAGQVLHLAGCDVHVLHTYEDLYPTPIGTLNSTSCIFKMIFKDGAEEKSFTVVGDSNEATVAHVNAVFEKGTLKSDILQVAHHGMNASAGTQHLKEFYAEVEPSIALFSNFEETVRAANFVPNSSLEGAEWIFSDAEQTINIF